MMMIGIFAVLVLVLRFPSLIVAVVVAMIVEIVARNLPVATIG